MEVERTLPLKEYLTAAGPAEAEIIIKRSRFIAHLSPAASVEEAEDFIAAVRARHSQASHNVPAFSVGLEVETQRASDDGEPSGTAGRPVLEVIKKSGLRDVAIVVTRYFGGILLGAGGLLRAYGQAASAAVTAAGLRRLVLHRTVLVSVDYPLFGKVQKEIERLGLAIEGVDCLEKVTVKVAVPVDAVPVFKGRMIDLTKARAGLEEGPAGYR